MSSTNRRAPTSPSSTLRTAWDALSGSGGDERLRAAHRAGLFFLVGGFAALAGSLLPHPVPSVPAAAAALGLVDLLVAFLLYRLPWQRWHPRATLVVVPVAFAVMWAFHSVSALTPSAFAAFMILVLFWVGLSHPPGTALALSPVFGLSYFWPAGHDLAAAHSALVVLPVAVLMAESTAATLRKLRRTQERETHRLALYRGLTDAMHSLSALDWDRACKQVIQATLHLDLDAATLNVIDPRSATYRSVHAHGLPEGMENAPVPMSVGITGLVYESRELVVIEDYGNDPRAIQSLREAGFNIAFGAPVLIGDRVEAVLVGLGRRRVHLSEDERIVFGMLADQVAVALANATRHRTVQDHADRYREVSLRDDVTGVGNRRFGQQLLDEIQPGDGLLMLDLDHFKRVNDQQGHEAGDRLLEQFGTFLRTTIREADRAARWGGEEFLVVLPQVGAELEAVAARLVLQWMQGSPVTSFSGGATLHRPDRSPAQSLKCADEALYDAKATGRCRITVKP